MRVSISSPHATVRHPLVTVNECAFKVLTKAAGAADICLCGSNGRAVHGSLAPSLPRSQHQPHQHSVPRSQAPLVHTHTHALPVSWPGVCYSKTTSQHRHKVLKVDVALLTQGLSENCTSVITGVTLCSAKFPRRTRVCEAAIKRPN